jgi:hypothetical protein
VTLSVGWATVSRLLNLLTVRCVLLGGRRRSNEKVLAISRGWH